jgi:hypothetical protein
MSRRKQREASEVPADLAIYNPEKYRAEALPGETVFTGSTTPSGAGAYYRALRRAGVRDGVAHRLRAAYVVRDLQAESGWTGPPFPWPTFTKET